MFNLYPYLLFFLKKKNIPFKDLIPEGFVDIHSHLLPGIDDGVKTISQSAYIIESLEQMGVEKIITTPHVMQDVWPNTSSIIRDKLRTMQEALASLKLDKIPLLASAEYMMDDAFLKRIQVKDILPLYDSYVLVEMSTFSAPINLSEMIFQIKVAGYSPILAHPERYAFYHDDFSKYEDLKTSGFDFQLNLLSLSGHYGKKVQKVAVHLLKKGYIDFVGSDIHNYQHLHTIQKGFSPKLSALIEPILSKNCVFT
ncbi:tyrosine-protein phosphatase [Aquimarina intermedia]|uniref:protein-tyrosine-phosphatase n=1 Tax=Aquimarina intermedia TaxID=350814 RepID=A0A5S5CA16_9FLAO|nr:CpsB/CapC family capsule biosynthesis tyrosine phosphatase [Aquimarina intermedia]TYP75170.1 tyrosine-protein phosphatase YwqE [Aquimarina intermedia]